MSDITNDRAGDNDAKTFSVKYEKKSSGLLNIDKERMWCVVGDKTVYDIPRDSIRFCTIGRKGVVVVNRESDGLMKTLSIVSKHAGAIRDALL